MKALKVFAVITAAIVAGLVHMGIMTGPITYVVTDQVVQVSQKAAMVYLRLAGGHTVIVRRSELARITVGSLIEAGLNARGKTIRLRVL